MKIPKILGLIMALTLVGVLAAGCAKKTTTPVTTTSEVTVGKGTVTVSITSTGSMDYADYENLSFAADGNVGTVNVKVGDLVKKGQVLAALDPTAWNNYIQSLTTALQNSQRSLTTAQSTLASNQRAVTTAQLNITQGQLNIQSDQNKLASDQNSLTNLTAVQTAQNAVDSAQNNLESAQAALQVAQAQGDNGSASFLTTYINQLKVVLAQANLNLKQVLNSTATTLTTTAALQITAAQTQLALDQLKITQDQNTLVGYQAAVDNANQSVTNSQQDVATAQTAVNTAQTNLNTANAASTQIVAPFDGAITTVNVQAGVGLSVNSSGAIKAGATAMVIADTSKFEANMLVNETDIQNISLGTMATVTATGLPGGTLSARVTDISPTATVQSGVVNYAVTATILGVAPATGSGTRTGGGAGNGTGPGIGTGTTTTTPATGQTDTTAATTPASQSGTTTTTTGTRRTGTGTFPTGTPGAGGTGSLTPDQIAQLQQAQAARQAAAAATATQLRQGLSLTVNLIEKQAVNVVVVPNQAIKVVSGKSYVQVKSSSGTPTQTEVTTGLKDYQNTQILTGLNGGETILITKTGLSVGTTTTTSRPGGIPGIGGGGILR